MHDDDDDVVSSIPIVMHIFQILLYQQKLVHTSIYLYILVYTGTYHNNVFHPGGQDSRCIVLELECLVSKQWQEQIRGFQPGQPAGCSWKKISGCRNIQEYEGI